MAARRPPAAQRHLRIRSPISGRVLRVFEESSRPLASGAPILEVGNTGSLELVADYLTQDAVRVRRGMKVFVAGWGGRDESGEERILEATVRTVEPGGFMKISALGVEEQRVNVIADPVGDPAEWATLGDGFRVELRILLWEQSEVLRVATGALFRDREGWAVFRIEGDRAFRRSVKIGRRSALHAQVLGGLAAGDRVVLYPSDLLGDDQPVKTVGE